MDKFDNKQAPIKPWNTANEKKKTKPSVHYSQILKIKGELYSNQIKKTQRRRE